MTNQSDSSTPGRPRPIREDDPTRDLVLVPGLRPGVDPDGVRRILDALDMGGYTLDGDRPDRDAGDERVLRTDVAGLPILSLSRGWDEDGSRAVEHAILCLRAGLSSAEERIRGKAVMRAILRTVGPASPDHPSMLCRSEAPWCPLVLQSYTNASDETDLDDGGLAPLLPPIAMVQESGLPSGERCLKLSSLWDVFPTDKVMAADAVETLRTLADARARPLGMREDAR